MKEVEESEVTLSLDSIMPFVVFMTWNINQNSTSPTDEEEMTNKYFCFYFCVKRRNVQRKTKKENLFCFSFSN